MYFRFDHWVVNDEQLQERWLDETIGDPNLLSWFFKEFHRRVPESELFLNDFNVFSSGISTQVRPQNLCDHCSMLYCFILHKRLIYTKP